MQEVKFCYQNISIDVQKDKAVVKNKNLFVNTDTFACVVLLEKEGKKLKEVPMEVSVEPLSEKTVELPIAVQTTSGRVCGDRFLPPERRYRMGQARP